MQLRFFLALVVCLAAARSVNAQTDMTGVRIAVTRSATVRMSSLFTPAAAAAPITLATSFPALEDSLTTPVPGPSGAVGDTYILTALNDRIRIQTKTGAIVGTTTLNAFWRGVIAVSAYGPKVSYDPFADRWIMIAGGDPRTGESSVLFAVSATDDPAGDWYLNAVDVDEALVVNGLWTEDVKLGFSKNWIVATANMYWGAGNWDGPKFDRTYLYAFDKAALYANSAPMLTRIWLNQQGKDNLVPVVTYDSTTETQYLVQIKFECTFIGAACDGFQSNSLNLFSLTGPVGSERVSTGPQVRGSHGGWSNETEGLRLPQLAAPASSVRGIETQRPGIASAVFRGGSIFAVHTIQLPEPTDFRDDYSADVSAVQFWEVTPSGARAQQAQIVDPDLVKSYAYPSIAVNSRHDVLVGFTRFGADQYPSAGYAFRAGADPRNQFREGQELKSGEGRFDRTITRVNNRPPVISWGDYSSTVVDPANDVDLWTLQQYAASRVDNDATGRWGTWWGRVSPPASAAAASIVPSGALPVSAGRGVGWTVSAYSPGGSLEYRFWRYRRSTQSWILAQDYSPARFYGWTTTQGDVGEWLIQAWVRQVGSTAPSEDWVSTDYFRVRNSPSVTLAADESSPLQAGETVAFTAAAVGEGPFEYRFWMFDEPQSRWRVVQEYSPNPVFIWSTSPHSAGAHFVQVWVRHTNDPFIAWEASANSPSMTVVSAQPGIAAVLSNVPLPVEQGTTMQWRAYGVGGGSIPLEYRFWRFSTGPGQPGVWSIVQEYSSSNVYTWAPSSAEIGVHLIQVWVRRVGSGVEYEGFMNSSGGYFRVTPGAPPAVSTIVSITTTLSSFALIQHVLAGPNRPVRFDVRGSDSGALEYHFWLYDLATNTRRTICPYNAQPVCIYSFDPDVDLGTKLVEAWVRRQGSPMDLEVSATTGFFVVRRGLLFHPE